jgi:hypothetical protein
MAVRARARGRDAKKAGVWEGFAAPTRPSSAAESRQGRRRRTPPSPAGGRSLPKPVLVRARWTFWRSFWSSARVSGPTTSTTSMIKSQRHRDMKRNGIPTNREQMLLSCP